MSGPRFGGEPAPEPPPLDPDRHESPIRTPGRCGGCDRLSGIERAAPQVEPPVRPRGRGPEPPGRLGRPLDGFRDVDRPRDRVRGGAPDRDRPNSSADRCRSATRGRRTIRVHRGVDRPIGSRPTWPVKVSGTCIPDHGGNSGGVAGRTRSSEIRGGGLDRIRACGSRPYRWDRGEATRSASRKCERGGPRIGEARPLCFCDRPCRGRNCRRPGEFF